MRITRMHEQAILAAAVNDCIQLLNNQVAQEPTRGCYFMVGNEIEISGEEETQGVYAIFVGGKGANETLKAAEEAFSKANPLEPAQKVRLPHVRNQ